jgi:hypothetical protein
MQNLFLGIDIGRNLLGFLFITNQVYLPIKFAEYRFPCLALVLLVRKGDLRLYWLTKQLHSSLLRGATALARIALNAGNNNVIPSGLATLRSWMNVVQIQFRSRKLLTAVLTGVVVPVVDTSAVEIYFRLPELVMPGQDDDVRPSMHCTRRPNDTFLGPGLQLFPIIPGPLLEIGNVENFGTGFPC